MASVENLITSYLFSNRVCPLPTVGMLQVEEQPAIVDTADKNIKAPVSTIRFYSRELPSDDLLEFIAREKGISVEEASSVLSLYCTRLHNLEAFAELPLPHAGKFYMNTDHLVFNPVAIPAEFFPPVHAERVIHPEVSHSILVGDKETTNTVMSEFYNEETVTKKKKWWIWPIILLVIAVIMIVVYFNDYNHSSSMGNATKVVPATESKTYEASP